MTESNEFVDWEQLSDEDKAKAEYLLEELNSLLDKYLEKDKECENSGLGDLKMRQESQEQV